VSSCGIRGGDKKGLGIVLTPRHLTELFVSLADVGPNDTVVDSCAGTGGFLISAMVAMDRKVGVDEGARKRIREHQLIGVEQLLHMFALAASNMILRGGCKANLYRGSCFDPAIIEQLKQGVPDRHERPTVGLVNPPFSQKGEGQHELEFVEVLLETLAPGGTAAVVESWARPWPSTARSSMRWLSLPRPTRPARRPTKAGTPGTTSSGPTWPGRTGLAPV
jgi:type I restriction enzyme M protein